MIEDSELLARYADENDQSAFVELVQRRIDLVYSVAVRQCGGDLHLAEDVTQRVFTDLARKATRLSRHPVLTGWLYRSAQFAATDVVRTERRRRAREQEAFTMDELANTGEPPRDWDRLRPLVDNVLNELSAADRDAVALRFFEQRPFAEIGARLRLSEEAARKRVERALERIRASLARRGVTSTAAALAAVLAQQGTTAAPTGLAPMIAETAAAMAATVGTLSFMNLTLLQAGGAAVVALVGATWVTVQGRANAGLRDELVAVQHDAARVETLRTENARLTRAAAEAEAWRRDDAEYARLSREIAALQRQRAAAPTAKSSPAPQSRLGDSVTLHLSDGDLWTVITALELYTGKTIRRDPSIAKVRASITVHADRVSREDAIALIKQQLLEHAHIAIETAPDGQLVAKLAPNAP